MDKIAISEQVSSESSHLSLEELAIWSRSFDVFICCASFESRSLTISQNINISSIGKTVIVHNPLLVDFNGQHFELMSNKFGERAMSIPVNADKPVQTDKRFMELLRELKKRDDGQVSTLSYLIDITTFTREVLLILLNSLRNQLSDGDAVTLIYNPAASYFKDGVRDGSSEIKLDSSNKDSQEQDPTTSWLTRGVREIRSVVGFPGEMLPSQPCHLIVLSGYENERADRLIEGFEPQFLSLGCGTREGSFQIEFHGTNIEFKKKITALYGRTNDFSFPPNDPFRTMSALEAELSHWPSTNIIIAPMNTKVSCVGAALLAWRHPSVQICYAQGDLYNYENYASPADVVYFYEFSDWIKASAL